MTKLNAQKGFTLVELAIVLTIIGLLLGGILKGRQLMQNARITATIAQIGAIEAATTTFMDTQGSLPGDMVDASTRIPNCANCRAPITGGDSKIGDPAWDLQSSQADVAVASPPADNESETLTYWAELGQSGLLGGVSYNGEAVTVANMKFGTHAPAARIGGGFSVGYANGTARQHGGPVANNFTILAGTVLMLSPNLTTAPASGVGAQIIDPALAGQIDRKYDDGLAATGRAQGSGTNSGTGCFNIGTGGTINDYLYNEALTGRNCDMFFQING